MKFTKICKMTQEKLKRVLMGELSFYYPVVINEDGFLYAKGTEPVLLTAHMDTVHKVPVKKVVSKNSKGKTILSSPQGIGGDDRCGIFMILEILRTTDYRPSILFCEDEEIGGVGSAKFCKTGFVEELKELKFFIELDRCNANDVVFYDCGNKDFQKFVEDTTGFETNFGSFSDISHLSPATDVASVNISCGYYKQHTLEEYVVYEEMMDAIKATIKLIEVCGDVNQFDYQEVKYSSKYNWYYDDFYTPSTKSKEVMYGMEFSYYDKDNNEVWDYVDGDNEMECLGRFLFEHPTLSYDDVLEYQPYYYDDYSYSAKLDEQQLRYFYGY